MRTSYIYKQRLLNVIKALRESPNPDKFTTYSYTYGPGVPSCPLGHYAAREDLQESFLLKEVYIVDMETTCPLEYKHALVRGHFGLDPYENEELFGEGGCGGAQTAEEAANYIENFVVQRALE